MSVISKDFAAGVRAAQTDRAGAIDVTTLRAAAEAAMDERWSLGTGYMAGSVFLMDEHGEPRFLYSGPGDDPGARATAAHIHAAQPAVVLALLDRLAAAEDEAARLREAVSTNA